MNVKNIRLDGDKDIFKGYVQRAGVGESRT